LHAHGFVRRRKAGLFVYYALADREVVRLCETICQRVVTAAPGQDGELRASPGC
jgi:hypothetical protein